jgi:hypothetical protein
MKNVPLSTDEKRKRSNGTWTNNGGLVMIELCESMGQREL